jgi:hypothetical protein
MNSLLPVPFFLRNIPRRAAGGLFWIAVLSVCFLSSCGGGARITAAPNPVPAGQTDFGSTTVTWTTGDGTSGNVYVSLNGGQPKLFASGVSGSAEATWIGAGTVYVFRLHAGNDQGKVLASVEVERNVR